MLLDALNKVTCVKYCHHYYTQIYSSSPCKVTQQVLPKSQRSQASPTQLWGGVLDGILLTLT